MEQQFKTVITANSKWINLHLKETYEYRDLIFLFVRRDFISKYKQTILGPLWAVIQPLLTTIVFTVIFGSLANLTTLDVKATEETVIPAFLFYMAGTICWSYFSSTVSSTANTFITNSSIMGKVYFPSIGMNGRVASMLEVGTGFHPELTGRENIYMNGAILGMSRAEIGEKLDQIIAFSECGEFIDTPVKRYSSGMYVKLAFSVAAHLDSEIMIMDEVLAVGDMKFQQKCLGRMGKAANSEEKTILYVSHNMNTIRQLCTRCLVLDHGELIFDGGVERAIDLYMDTAVKNGSVDIDLKNKRMAHLPPVIKAKMTHVHLVDKQVPVYEFEEKLKFDLSVEAKTNISNLSVRAEIRSADGGSVAAGILQEFTSFSAGRSKILEMELLLRGLVPGKYFVLLVIYNVNEMGTYDDLDAVFPAFTFEIQDSKHALKINWNVNAWGKIRLDDLKCVGERDDS